MRVPAVALLLATSAQASTLGVYYSETGFGDTVSRLNVNSDITTATFDNLVSIPNQDPRAIAIDHTNLKVYYANGNAIWKANLDGTGQALVTTTIGGPGDIEIDSANGHLYYSTGSGTPTDRRIRRVNTDGTGVTTIHDATTLATFNPLDTTITTKDVGNISLDLDNGLLYWTSDNGANAGRIAMNSSALAGGVTTQHFVAASRNEAIGKMDIDFDTGTVYFTVGSSTISEVRSSAIDGSSLTTLYSSGDDGIGRPAAIALDPDSDDVFFTVGGIMYQGNTDGTDALTFKSINGSGLFNIADMEVAVPEPSSLALLGFAGLALLRRRR
jgi:hypothetical protein